MNTYSPKILLTGAHGQLGMTICHHVRSIEFQLLPCSRIELDITDFPTVSEVLKTYSPDIVINSAAYTAVDKAEQEPDAAMLINYIGARNLAIVCENHHIPLIHLSTDYIFDGLHSLPYSENIKAKPINVYGQSKWLGEQAIREHCEQYIILRVSGIFSKYGHNFLKTILRLAQEKKELRIVADQMTSPTSAEDIAHVLFAMVQQLPRWGTYHYCSAPAVSWYQFAYTIIEIAKKHQSCSVEEIFAIQTSAYPTPAKRPLYSVLDCSKLAQEMGIKQSIWKKALEMLIPQLVKGI